MILNVNFINFSSPITFPAKSKSAYSSQHQQRHPTLQAHPNSVTSSVQSARGFPQNHWINSNWIQTENSLSGSHQPVRTTEAQPAMIYVPDSFSFNCFLHAYTITKSQNLICIYNYCSFTFVLKKISYYLFSRNSNYFVFLKNLGRAIDINISPLKGLP